MIQVQVCYLHLQALQNSHFLRGHELCTTFLNTWVPNYTKAYSIVANPISRAIARTTFRAIFSWISRSAKASSMLTNSMPIAIILTTNCLRTICASKWLHKRIKLPVNPTLQKQCPFWQMPLPLQLFGHPTTSEQSEPCVNNPSNHTSVSGIAATVSIVANSMSTTSVWASNYLRAIRSY